MGDDYTDDDANDGNDHDNKFILTTEKEETKSVNRLLHIYNVQMQRERWKWLKLQKEQQKSHIQFSISLLI